MLEKSGKGINSEDSYRSNATYRIIAGVHFYLYTITSRSWTYNDFLFFIYSEKNSLEFFYLSNEAILT